MANYKIVEGPWADGKYMFRRVQKSDYDAVVEHLQKYFLHDEPTSKLLGYSDQFGEEFGLIAKEMLADNLSFLVAEQATGEVGISHKTNPFKISCIDEIELVLV